MVDNNKVVLLDKDNKEHTYEIILTFDASDSNKSYIIYTENKYDKNKKLIVYARWYNKNTKDKQLHLIEKDSEWKFINDLLTSMEDNNEKQD